MENKELSLNEQANEQANEHANEQANEQANERPDEQDEVPEETIAMLKNAMENWKIIGEPCIIQSDMYSEDSILNMWAHFRVSMAKDISTIPIHLVKRNEEFIKTPIPTIYGTVYELFSKVLSNPTDIALNIVSNYGNDDGVRLIKKDDRFYIATIDGKEIRKRLN